MVMATRIFFLLLFQNNQLLLIDNDYTTEKINSGAVPGISCVYESGDKEKKNTTIEISQDISAKTFVHVLEFLYSGIINLLLDMYSKQITENVFSTITVKFITF